MIAQSRRLPRQFLLLLVSALGACSLQVPSEDKVFSNATPQGGTASSGGASDLGGQGGAETASGGTTDTSGVAGAAGIGGEGSGGAASGGTSAANTGGTLGASIGGTSAANTGGTSARGSGGTSAASVGGTSAASVGGTSTANTGGTRAITTTTGGSAGSSTAGVPGTGGTASGGAQSGGAQSGGATFADTAGTAGVNGGATGVDAGGASTSAIGGTTSMSNFVYFIKQANGTTTASMASGTITVSATHPLGNAFKYVAPNYYGTNSNGFIALPTTMTGDFAATAIVDVTALNNASNLCGIGLGIATGFQPTDEYAYILMRNSNVINAMYVSAAGNVGTGSPSVNFSLGTPMQLTFSRTGANLTYGAGPVGGNITTQTAAISYFTDQTTVYGGGTVYPTISFNNVNATITQLFITDASGATVFNSDTGTLVAH
jgi:hypothetical protein